MKKIEKLTPEQEALLPVYRDRWLAIGLSTEPLNFERAKSAAVLAYKCAGLKPPKYFYRFQSPLSAAVGAALLKSENQVGDQVGSQVMDQVWAQARSQVWVQVKSQVMDQVWDQTGSQVGSQVWDQIGSQVMDQVRSQARCQVWDLVRDQVWDLVRDLVRSQVSSQVRALVRSQVSSQVWAQVGDQVWALVRSQVGDQASDQAYGCHDANWLGFYAFFKEIGIETNILNGLIEIAENCGWWAPYQNAVILQDRPTKILFDDQKRLHCADGPAIEYRDGFCVYSWHGTRIPGKWIDNPLPAAEALRWENMEQRRAACEILGWDRILNELNAVTLDKHPDPEVGELVEVEIPDIGREKFLRVRCGTSRTFALPVPPSMQTALESNAWTYSLDPEDYSPEVRT